VRAALAASTSDPTTLHATATLQTRHNRGKDLLSLFDVCLGELGASTALGRRTQTSQRSRIANLHYLLKSRIACCMQRYAEGELFSYKDQGEVALSWGRVSWGVSLADSRQQ
jgi:hypothetical protein